MTSRTVSCLCDSWMLYGPSHDLPLDSGPSSFLPPDRKREPYNDRVTLPVYVSVISVYFRVGDLRGTLFPRAAVLEHHVYPHPTGPSILVL